MEIAKGISAELYKKLDLTIQASQDWDKAFEYFDKRISERYLEPVDVLIAYEKSKFPIEKKFGFTIFAIDCLLIETLQSFYEGITDSSGHSQRLFKNFLMQRDYFKSYFETDYEAKQFYINFRCGILHQAQTFGDTKIWSVGELIRKEGNYQIVNRIEFHNAVKKEKELYLISLRTKTNAILLTNFKTKMDFIASP